MDFQDAINIAYPTKTFSGSDFQQVRDEKRLTGQLADVFRFMRTYATIYGCTLREISNSTGAPESSVSAQLRNLRKPQFGRHTVLKRYIGKGLYSYQLVIKSTAKQ